MLEKFQILLKKKDVVSFPRVDGTSLNLHLYSIQASITQETLLPPVLLPNTETLWAVNFCCQPNT